MYLLFAVVCLLIYTDDSSEEGSPSVRYRTTSARFTGPKFLV